MIQFAIHPPRHTVSSPCYHVALISALCSADVVSGAYVQAMSCVRGVSDGRAASLQALISLINAPVLPFCFSSVG